jgi:hypothetical protein
MSKFNIFTVLLSVTLVLLAGNVQGAKRLHRRKASAPSAQSEAAVMGVRWCVIMCTNILGEPTPEPDKSIGPRDVYRTRMNTGDRSVCGYLPVCGEKK